MHSLRVGLVVQRHGSVKMIPAAVLTHTTSIQSIHAKNQATRTSNESATTKPNNHYTFECSKLSSSKAPACEGHELASLEHRPHIYALKLMRLPTQKTKLTSPSSAAHSAAAKRLRARAMSLPPLGTRPKRSTSNPTAMWPGATAHPAIT